MSALTGMGIDNAVVELNNVEVPILDGSAQPYVKAFSEAGLVEQDADEIVEFLAIAKEIAYYYHEKWDGSGYSNGLVGDVILICARLMALADVFDALTCRRVYKAPMPIEQAHSIIVEGRGLHFDPDIVDAFIKDFAIFAEIAQRYADDDMH